MNKKLSQLINLLKTDIKLLLSISLGVFLFVLFFEPFSLEKLDSNNRLIFIAGLGAIVFLFMVLVRGLIYILVQQLDQDNHQELVLPTFLGSFIMLALSAVAFAFYLRYVGLVSITFHVMFKVVIICLAPPVILRIYDTTKALRRQNESLINEKKVIQKQIEKYEEDYLNTSIEFISEYPSENLTLVIADVVFVKSANNYVELIYKENDIFNKKLIRNTLKNIEQQIKSYSNFIRCHRTCIVNTHYIEKLHRSHNNYWIIIKGYPDHIPVSRQYLLKLKEIL